MTRDRLEAIFCSLHLCSIADDEENKKKRGTAVHDRLLKIEPLYNQILDACKSLYQPGREITINERVWLAKPELVSGSS